MIANVTKVYSNHVSALVSNQVHPSGEYYSSFKCLHLGEIKSFCQNIPQFLPKNLFVQDYQIKFCLEQSTKVENG